MLARRIGAGIRIGWSRATTSPPQFAAIVCFATCAPVVSPTPLPPSFADVDDARDDALASEPNNRPFSDVQLREANPAGTVLVYRHEQKGEPPVEVEMTFLETSDARAVLREVMRNEHGSELGERKTEIAWETLIPDAALEAAAADIGDSSVQEAGSVVPCRLYTVRDGESLSRFCFDPARPGPPILFEQETGGEVFLRVTFVERREPT